MFAILLAPWEDWVDLGPFWRGFEVPWAYRIDDDIFVRPSPPPSPDTLSWDPVLDDKGEEVGEWPRRISLKADISGWLTDSRWADLTRAQETPLFETPVKHFFVKAFLEDPLDEFLAHMLTIEAALGLESDYPRATKCRAGAASNGEPRNGTRRRKGATKLLAARVSALLEARNEGETYCNLFNLRSAFLHGRKMDAPIPGEERLTARRLAQKVVHKLIDEALKRPYLQCREEYLNALAS